MNCRLIAPLLVLGAAALSAAQISGPVPLAWRWAGPTTVSPYGAPLVDGGSVFVGVGSRVYCLDKATGNKKWQYPLLDPIDGTFSSNLSVKDGVLYAAGTNKTLYAIDPATGEQKWSYVAPGAIVGKMAFSGASIVLNVDGNSLMAVNTANGEAIWPNPERVFDGIRGNIFSIGTTVYFLTHRADLYAINVSTRRSDRLAKFQSVPADVVPVVAGDSILVCSGSVLVNINSEGNVRWQKNLSEDLIMGPAISTEGVMAVSSMGKAYLMDLGGNMRSRKEGDKIVPAVIDLGSRPITPPSAVGKLFAVATANGALNLIDPAKAEVIWSFTIRPLTAGILGGGTNKTDELISVPAVGPSVVSGSTLFQLVSDGSLLAFDPETGVDLTGPAVNILWPQAGQQVGNVKGPLDMYFKVQDEATGVNDKSVAVTANGQPVVFEFGRDGILSLRFGQNAKNKSLPNGRLVIQVSAADWLGNVTTQKYSFLIDNDLGPLARPGGKPAGGVGGQNGPTSGGQGTGGGGGTGRGGGSGGIG